jgi:hypothetical protein
MTLGDSERLPLPHTKGTKPAPSSVKVLVYLIQVKKYIFMKKRINNQAKSTGEGARTPTPLREMDFESIASTNSATPANVTVTLNKQTEITEC